MAVGYGEIGPIRRGLLDEAKFRVGELMANAGTKLDQYSGLVGAGVRAATGVTRAPTLPGPGTLSGLKPAGEALQESANGFPLIRMDRGLMSLDVDPRVLDVAGWGAAPAARVITQLPKAVKDIATGVVEDAARGGMAPIVAGRKSATADLAKLARAEALDQRITVDGQTITADQKRDYIFKETGWWRGKDGEWRYEISDSAAYLKPVAQQGEVAAPLGDLLKHPELFRAYPDLADVRASLRYDEGSPRSGAYFAGSDRIEMRAPNTTKMIDGLLHEGNHGVQRREGFAPGGTPEYAAEYARRTLENDPFNDTPMSLNKAGLLAHYASEPEKAYLALAGEVESRAVEARRTMQPAARAAKPFYKSFDVPEAQQTVITGDRMSPLALAGDGAPPSRPRLRGLPETLAVPGVGEVPVGPDARVRQVASDYMQKTGLEYAPIDELARVDPRNAKAVAAAYDAMPHAPDDPAVQGAYSALAKETMAQWQAIKDSGLKVEFIKPGMDDPYAASPRLAIRDINENNHLWVFPTDQGFGGPSSKGVDVSGNPLFADSGEIIDGKPAQVNDIFRIVHDYFGHAKEGNGFRADGEETAARLHAAMFSPEARAAMLTETRGQNSWVNFGPYAEQNRTASGAATEYAPQKTGLLPEWAREIDYNAPQRGELGGVSTPSSLLPAQGRPVINVGMQVGDGTGQNLGVTEIRRALKRIGVDIKRDQIRRSDTEDTFVAQLARPLTDQEAHDLAVTLRQEAIPQRVGSVGTMHGPQKEKWGEFNPKYFKGLTPRAKGQTVADPLRLNNPKIYENPRTQVERAAAQVAPEHPGLQRLFGVSRQDLADIALGRRSTMSAQDVYGGIGPRSEGSEHARQVMTRENATRIGDILTEAKKNEKLAPGMIGWYVQDALMDRWLRPMFGADAVKQFNLLNAALSTHSFMSPVEVEMARGSAANMFRNRGLFDLYAEHGGKPAEWKSGAQPLLGNVPGHVAHKGQAQSFRNFYERGLLPNSAKAPSYYYAGGTPETGFQTNLPVGDTHFAEGVGLNDVRPVVSGNATSTEMLPLGPWYGRIAEDVGMSAVSGQGLQWGAMAPATGVETAIGAPKLEIMAIEAYNAAERLGITPEEALRRILMGEEHFGGLLNIGKRAKK